ncbi:Hypothetical predicted protein [Mytilus galloprovincialis]|uniref:Uncharacterized protein n=1 Tax=Mytilus galloprovincialis TaxID=29158 RepID=A0A8B6CC86_MYTGA|nr:Hypothetical predicted protein [Mytilus galloprovincialis]
MVSTNVEGDGTASRDVKIASAPLQEPATKNHYPVLDIGFDHWTQRRRLDVGFSPMDGGSHAGWIFADGWWITCRLDFRRWMVDHMQVGFSPMDGGSHAGWIFADGWWITCKLDLRR